MGKIITRLYPSAHINQNNDNNYIVMKRDNTTPVVISDMNCVHNLTENDVASFQQILDSYPSVCNGIMISQNSGIVSKPNFHIDCTSDGRINVYIHHLEYDADKLKTAVDIIDNITSKLNGKPHVPLTIPLTVLEEINREFQDFVERKENISNIIKDSLRNVISQLDTIKFSALNTYLSENFTETKIQKTFPCTQCNKFNGNNLKALAAHKRGCNRKALRQARVCQPATASA